MSHIKTATIRPLRTEFSKVLAWVNAGEEVAITPRREVVANLTPAGERTKQKLILPDFHARLKRSYGEKILPAMTTQATLEDSGGA